MHIRNFILMGVFLGAAAFLPNHAFAEKNGAAGQPEPQNPAVHTPVLEKNEEPLVTEKAMPVTPENVHKNQGEVVQNPGTNPRTKQTSTNPVPKSPNKTNKGIEKAALSSQKNIKSAESAEPAAKEKAARQTGPSKPNAVTNKPPEDPKSLTSNQTGFEEENNSRPSGLDAKSEPYPKDTEPSVSIKTNSSLTLPQKPLKDEENKTPANNRQYLGDIEILSNPPPRTPSAGGQSNEQFSPGTGTTSFIASRLDWDEYFGLNLGQLYTSRQAKYCHQWINAPPLPPPKAAPFFTTFTVN
ncbi:hypothetical protein [Neobacillus bataviensis]|uniref:hypothetical protein n=1 Tax=Neobacillus bataviensis TaxID=220685 RepID=UPI001CC1096F|nr:hypothetical protein [Neobacillus bataviensis]